MNPLRHALRLAIRGTKIATGRPGAARWAIDRSVATRKRLHQMSAPLLARSPCNLLSQSA
jgi:hypothetical protein